MALALALDVRLALAFSGAQRRPALEALYAIDAEIAAATRPGLDHAVAHAKLGWWRGEVDRLAAGRPEHPLARTLRLHGGDGPRYARWHERLTAAELTLAGHAPGDLPALLLQVDRAEGAVQTLAAEVLEGGSDAALERFGAALGRGLGLAAALAAPGSAPDGPLPRAQLLALARASLESAPQLLPGEPRTRQAHGLVRATLALARLERPGQSPLVQLWLAWQSARRARQE